MSFYNYRVKRKRKYRSMNTVEADGYRRKRRRKTTHSSHHRKKRFRAWRVLLVMLIILGCAGGVGVGAFRYLQSAGRKNLQAYAVTSEPDIGEQQEDSGAISRNGKKYHYNEDMLNILCMGIDRTTDLSSDEQEVGENGQADTIFLLALDTRENTMKVIGISRDTMTEVSTFDKQGNYVGRSVNHLGIAFSYGDGAQESGELMTEAVAGLMYELPIHGYVAVNLNAIEKLNNSVGGVTVTLDGDMTLAGEAFVSGSTLNLNGVQAEAFVRSRDMEEAGSNNLRMARQKQYMMAFVNAAKQVIKKNPTVVATLYGDLTADMTTSIGLDEAVYLASLLPGMTFSVDDIQMLAGTTEQGAVYEEFYVDEEKLIDTILEVFFDEVS